MNDIDVRIQASPVRLRLLQQDLYGTGAAVRLIQPNTRPNNTSQPSPQLSFGALSTSFDSTENG